MRCFTACFHTLKHRKKQKPRTRTALKDLIDEKCEATQDNKLTNELQPADFITTIAQSKDENEEQLNSSSKKKVTFNLDVKTSDCSPTQAAAECILENEVKKEEGEEKEEGKDEADVLSDSTTSSSSYISYPLDHHRYQKCRSSDDEYEDIELNESDLVDDVTGKGDEDGCVESGIAQEDSSESLFSISIDYRKQVSAAEMGDKEVNSPLKSCYREMKSKGLNQRVLSILSPVENISQWKAVKVKATRKMDLQEKENINLEQENLLRFSKEPDLKQPIGKQGCDEPNKKENEVAADTSLSSWLVESGKTPNAKNSPGSVCNSTESTKTSKKVQYRTILGALADVEIKQLSSCSSPRRSLWRSPDNTRVIGTVGSFWRHTGQATDSGSGSGSSSRGHSGTSSKCVELGEVSRHSTPFHTRLDRALESGIV